MNKETLYIIDWLAETFPHTFFKKGSEIKPLKIGIFDDIIDFCQRLKDPPSKDALKSALTYYSISKAYLTCQKTNKARLDIYGNEVDVVTADQANYAHQRYLARYQHKKKAS